MIEVAVVGLGYVGLVNAMFLAFRGFRVYGFDRSSELVARLRRGNPPIQEEGAAESLNRTLQSGALTVHPVHDFSEFPVSVTIVCVPTPCEAGSSADLSALDDAAERIGRVARPGQLVILRSTVPPGTTRGRFFSATRGLSGTAGADLHVAFCPERLAEGCTLTEQGLQDLLTKVPMLVGGVDEASAAAAVAFWEQAGISCFLMTSCDAAELAKLLSNEWIDLNIALANEFALLCQRVGLDVLEVIKAANTLPKGESTVNVLLPGVGVGGSCLTKDPWLLEAIARDVGLAMVLPATARRINARMPDHVISIMEEELNAIGKRFDGASIAVLGLAFKESTADTRESPAAEVVADLRSRGAELRLHDPWVRAQRDTYLDMPIFESLEGALDGADCVLLVTAHPEYARLKPDVLRKHLGSEGIVVDGRRAWSPHDIRCVGLRYRAIGLGDTRPGVGTKG